MSNGKWAFVFRCEHSNMSTIWTIGHSTRSAEEFVRMIETHGIELLADVRAFPSSRRYPQFNKSALQESLSTAGVIYRHMPSLGGRRQPSPHSKNTAWKNSSFRAYADYMETNSFTEGISSLIELAKEKRTAIMCAEALWWRCHRSLLADYFKASGWEVLHIVSETKTEDHPYTAAATVRNGKLSYAGLFGEAGSDGS
jgi:uncharacterized protein (DUF488 family)